MIPLLKLPARSVYYLPGTAPAVFYLADNEGGGVLINTPPFSHKLAGQLGIVALPRYVFVPSRNEYAFTDDFDPVRSRYGPGAGRAITLELDKALQAA